MLNDSLRCWKVHPNVFLFVQWISLVLVKGGSPADGRSMDDSGSGDPLEGKDYTWYISGIYCQLGDYIIPTTFYKNLKNPLRRYLVAFVALQK